MSLKLVQTDRDDVRDLWDATDAEVDRIDGASIGVRSSLVTHTFGGAGSAVLKHKLGRQPAEWIVTDITAAVTLHRSAWTADTITLVAGGACSVKVRVL